MEQVQKPMEKPFLLLKAMAASYILTGLLLMILAFLMLKAGLTENQVSIGIIAVYVLSTFLGGRIAGKGAGSRKFVWGMAAGGGYFLILLLVTLFLGHTQTAAPIQLVTTFLMCAGGGMLGGMLSP